MLSFTWINCAKLYKYWIFNKKLLRHSLTKPLRKQHCLLMCLITSKSKERIDGSRKYVPLPHHAHHVLMYIILSQGNRLYHKVGVELSVFTRSWMMLGPKWLFAYRCMGWKGDTVVIACSGEREGLNFYRTSVFTTSQNFSSLPGDNVSPLSLSFFHSFSSSWVYYFVCFTTN